MLPPPAALNAPSNLRRASGRCSTDNLRIASMRSCSSRSCRPGSASGRGEYLAQISRCLWEVSTYDSFTFPFSTLRSAFHFETLVAMHSTDVGEIAINTAECEIEMPLSSRFTCFRSLLSLSFLNSYRKDDPPVYSSRSLSTSSSLETHNIETKIYPLSFHYLLEG